MSVFCHFWLVSTIFSCFSSIFDCFAAIHLQCLPIGRTVWHSSLAWQNRIGELGPPLTGKIFGRKGLSFGRTEWLDPSENDPATHMPSRRNCITFSNIDQHRLHVIMSALKYDATRTSVCVAQDRGWAETQIRGKLRRKVKVSEVHFLV